MSEDITRPFTFRVEISPEQVDAIAPRLREALAASGNDGDITRRAAAIADREEQLRRDQEDLERRARQLGEREAELGKSNEMTASERIRFAERRHHIEMSEHEIDSREHSLLQREAEFEADVLLREDRLERWRSELTALEEQLERRERDLAAYVDQLQGSVSYGDPLPTPPGITELRRLTA
jgi:chromosome segregation ATPase